MQVRGPKSGFRKTIKLRRKSRRNPTPAEKKFWAIVANGQFHNLKFRKQHGIGNYIVDFCYPAEKLIIEIDGDIHATGIRTKYLKSLGYKIIRYNNSDVLNNTDGVFQDLSKKLSLL